MMEIVVLNPSSVEEEYRNEISEITKYYNAKELPPLEKPINFDDDIGKFSKTWQVAYSSYLTRLYGLENQFAFDNKYAPIAEKWNRVLNRIKEDKKMTEANKQIIKEIEAEGFDLEKIKEKLKGRESN